MKTFKFALIAVGLLFLGGLIAFYFYGKRSKVVASAQIVSDFDVNKYLGTWYEIARYESRFEKNLKNVTAQYSLAKDGKVIVLNKGQDRTSGEWKDIQGKARFRGETNIAALEVSFFGPFYSGYNVIALDADYSYALVYGENHRYLWILAREKSISEEVKNKLLETAAKDGYDTSTLLWVEHDAID